MRKRIIPFLLALFCIAHSFCGCASAGHTYSVAKSEVYLAGDLLKGPSINPVDAEITLSSSTVKKGVDIGFDYFGQHYHGTVSNDGKIVWDKVPVMIGEGTYLSSTIENYNSGIKMSFKYSVRSLTAESVLVFSPK